MNTNAIGRTLQRVGSMLSGRRSTSTRTDRTTRGRTTRDARTGTRGGGGLMSRARRFLRR